MKILIVKDHTRARAKLFCGKSKVSSYLCFEVGQLKKEKKMENPSFYKFPYVTVAVYFKYFEGLSVYENTRIACYVSKKAYNRSVREFWAVIFVKG